MEDEILIDLHKDDIAFGSVRAAELRASMGITSSPATKASLNAASAQINDISVRVVAVEERLAGAFCTASWESNYA